MEKTENVKIKLISQRKLADFISDFLEIERPIFDIARKIVDINEIFEHNDKLSSIADVMNREPSSYYMEFRLSSFRPAYHDKNLLAIKYHSRHSSYDKDLLMPLEYLSNEKWEEKYIKEKLEDKRKTLKDVKNYKYEQDMKAIERLKKEYPDKF